MFLHRAVRDEVWPSGTPNAGDPIIPNAKTSCAPVGRDDSPLDGAAVGLVSSVYSPFKQLPRSQDFLWGFNPLAFDLDHVEWLCFGSSGRTGISTSRTKPEEDGSVKRTKYLTFLHPQLVAVGLLSALCAGLWPVSATAQNDCGDFLKLYSPTDLTITFQHYPGGGKSAQLAAPARREHRVLCPQRH